MPADVVAWSKGRALVATGIPVDPVHYEGVTYTIGQGNNALLNPGLGLGTIVSGARHVTDGMLLAAAEAVAGQVDPTALGASLLPPVDNLRASSATVALTVAKQAEQDAMWQPVHPDPPAHSRRAFTITCTSKQPARREWNAQATRRSSAVALYLHAAMRT